jgi:hypothetical protein
MKDIFLSYKKLDAERVRVLVEAFERSGFTVWWDREIPAGKSWAEVIEEAITTCRCVVVVWSENSVDAEWVHKEARKGEQRRNLIPVMIDAVQPPFEFEHVQAANLVGWDGVSELDQYEQLVERIEAVIKTQPGDGGEDAVEAARVRKVSRSRAQLLRRGAATVIIAVSVLAAALGLLTPSRGVEVEFKDLKLSGVRFQLSHEERGGSSSVLILNEIPVAELIASGLQSVDVPSTAESSGATYADDPLVVLETTDVESTVGLAGLELPAAASVELRKAVKGYELVVRGAAEPLAVQVSGRVAVGIEDDETLDFGVGGRVSLRPDAELFQLEFLPVAGDLTLFENVVIDDLRLYRVDQDVDLEQTTVDVVSTIHGGRLEADWLSDRELGAGEVVRFDSFEGEINNLRLVGDTIVLSAHASRVSGLRSGSGDGESLMPTLLGSFSVTGKLLVALIGVVYLAGLIFLTRRLWRRTI